MGEEDTIISSMMMRGNESFFIMMGERSKCALWRCIVCCKWRGGDGFSLRIKPKRWGENWEEEEEEEETMEKVVHRICACLAEVGTRE